LGDASELTDFNILQYNRELTRKYLPRDWYVACDIQYSEVIVSPSAVLQKVGREIEDYQSLSP